MIGAIVQGLASGTAYALIAVGLILVFKGSRVLNLVQGEIGAFSLLLMMALWRVVGWYDGEDVTSIGAFSALTLLVAAIVVSVALGLLIERLIMRRLVERPAVDGTIATLGVAVVLINLEFLVNPVFLAASPGSYSLNVPPLVGSTTFEVLGATINPSLVIAAIVTAALGAGLAYFFRRTKFGLGVVAATSDNTVARILGIPVDKVYMFTWGIGGALSGLAAALVTTGLNGAQIKPGDMTLAVIIALGAAVIGGLDNIWGGIVGGLLVGVIRSVADFSFNAISGAPDLAVLLLVLLTLMVRPRGLLGGAGAEVV